MKLDQHELRQDLRRVADELGHAPSRDEYRERGKFATHSIERAFGNWSMAKIASGIAESKKDDSAKPGKEKKFTYVPPKVDQNSFLNLITVDLKELFDRAGNPEYLTLIAMPDTHVEHMDEDAVSCFLEYVKFKNPDLFIIMGDFLNAGGLSHWGQDDLAPMRIAPEIKAGRELLRKINEYLGKCVFKAYLEGNHEDWINQFIRSGTNPQLFDGLADIGINVDLKTMLGLDALGFNFYEMNKILKIGLSAFTHGLYTGDNHAKQHLMRLMHTIFYGHTHDSKSYTGTSIMGTVEAQSFSCLCSLDPKFMRRRPNNWEHGFGELTIFPDGTFLKVFHPIKGGRLMAAGKIFESQVRAVAQG